MITYVTVCRSRFVELARTLPRLLAQPGNVEVVLVDFGSTTPRLDEWARREQPRARVVRVEESGRFHMSRARNAGAAVARGDWLVFVEADVLLIPDFTERLAPHLRPGRFLCAEGMDGTFGFCVVERAVWERTKYDERLTGYGRDDCDFFRALRRAGLAGARLPNAWFRHLELEKYEKAKLWGDWRADVRWNDEYLRAKHGLAPDADCGFVERYRLPIVGPAEHSPAPPRATVLLVSLWPAADATRAGELQECLAQNLLNPALDRVVVFAQGGRARLCAAHPRLAARWAELARSEKLEWAEADDAVPTFGELFQWGGARFPGRVVVVANADVYFEESLGRLRAADLADTLVCLAKRNRDALHNPAGSHDAWAFVAPLGVAFDAPWPLGTPYGELRLAYEAHRHGLRVLNPCLEVAAHHLHDGWAAKPDDGTGSAGPIRYVAPSRLRLPADASAPTRPAPDGKKRLLFILPGLHGDVVLFAPIAAWYAAQGYEVTWPVPSQWTYRTLLERLDYVKPHFVDAAGGDVASHAYALADSGLFDKVVDVWTNTAGGRVKLPVREESYVATRYAEAGVPLDERWNFRYRREPARERELYARVVGAAGLEGRAYALVHDETWEGRGESLAAGAAHPVVRFRPVPGFSLLDWREVLARAAELRLLDSSLANFAETLPELGTTPKTLLRRYGHHHASLYRGNWRIVQEGWKPRHRFLFDLDTTRLDLPAEQVCAEPPLARGLGRVLVVRPDSDGSDAALARVDELPALLAGRDVWANVSRVRRGRLWLTRRSGHRYGATLLRDVGDDGRRWLARIEAPADMVDGAEFWLADGTAARAVGRHRLPAAWELELDRAPDLPAVANYFRPPDGEATKCDPRPRYEALYALFDGSLELETDGWRLSEKELAGLALRRLEYVADLAAAERPHEQEYATYRPEPERWTLHAAERPTSRAVAVGVRALKALDGAARTGATAGEYAEFPKPDGRWAYATGAGLLARLPLPTELDFYPLAARLGPARTLATFERARDAGLRFGAYGDLLLVLTD